MNELSGKFLDALLRPVQQGRPVPRFLVIQDYIISNVLLEFACGIDLRSGISTGVGPLALDYWLHRRVSWMNLFGRHSPVIYYQ